MTVCAINGVGVLGMHRMCAHAVEGRPTLRCKGSGWQRDKSRTATTHQSGAQTCPWQGCSLLVRTAANSEQVLRKWTLQTISSPNTIVCDLGLESHHAVDVIGLHGLVWSEGSETSVSYDLLLLLPGTCTVCPRSGRTCRQAQSRPAAWTG